MKKLNSTEEVKQFSISLQNFLKQNNIDVKHSLMLEGIAKSMNEKDWNTLSAVLNKPNNVKEINYSQLSFDHHKRINAGTGGYDLYYNNEHQILKISTSFFYSMENSHYFSLSKETIEKFVIYLEQFHSSNDIDDFVTKHSLLAEAQTTIGIDKSGNLKFSNNNSSILINQLNNPIVISSIFDFFANAIGIKDKKLPTMIYPLTTGLINSMCMRYDHSFGLWDDDEKIDKLRNKMTSLYHLYKSDVSDDEIKKQTNIDSISISQLREEVDGRGYYKPQKKSSQNSIN